MKVFEKIKELDELNIQYEYKISKGKRIVLKVKDSILYIHIPKYANFSDVRNLVINHLDWIKKAISKHPKHIRYFVDGESYLIHGVEYKLRIIKSYHPDVILDHENRSLIVYSTDLSYDVISKMVDKWKRKYSIEFFGLLRLKVIELYKSYFPTIPEFNVKKYKSRWGVCYSKQNKIILNESLIHVPTDCVIYVMLHELTHLIYPNHSNKFHDYLKSIIDEKSLNKKLNLYICNYE